MTDEELATHLRWFFKHPPDEGLGFVKSFIAKVKRGWPVTAKMRFKAARMVDESYDKAEVKSLLEDE